MSRRVVITGIGIVSPLGLTADEHWQRRMAGTVGIGPIQAFDASGFACGNNGGEVPEYALKDYVPKTYRKFAKVMARDIELAVIAADGAFKSSGLKSKADGGGGGGGEPSFEPSRFGCNIGAGLISCELDELTYALDQARDRNDPSKIDWQAWGRDGIRQLTPLWLLKYLPNMLACHVTIIHGLTGPSNNITCAEASGHLSVGEAVRSIRRGKCDLAIAGGCETLLSPMGTMRQQLLGRLTRGDGVRPFDQAADGCAAAEGGALLIVEELEHAKSRGATIYAEVAGFGSSQDTYDPALPDPEGKAYAAACRAALREANADPADVSAIFPHGLGIPHHDASEVAGLHRVFGDDLSKPALCPIKHATGTTAAGTAIDLAFAAMAVKDGSLPPSTTTSPIDASINVTTEQRDLAGDVVLASTFGMGGQNAAVVLRRVS